jgi:hypothetical protein
MAVPARLPALRMQVARLVAQVAEQTAALRSLQASSAQAEVLAGALRGRAEAAERELQAVQVRRAVK